MQEIEEALNRQSIEMSQRDDQVDVEIQSNAKEQTNQDHSQRSLRTNRKRDYKKMLDGDDVFQRTIEDEQIEIRKQFLDQQELEQYNEYQSQYKGGIGRVKKNLDKIFSNENDIEKDKKAVKAKNG